MEAYLEDLEDLGEVHGDPLSLSETDLEDPFFGSLIRRVPWRKLAKVASRSVLKGGGISDILSGLLSEDSDGAWSGEDFEVFDGFGEYEDWESAGGYDAEGDYESGAVYEMEALAESIMTAESEAEADAFVGALVSAASSILPKVLSIGKRVLPSLISGARGLSRTLRRSPQTRNLVRTMPTIARKTVAQLLRDHARGMPVNAQRALRTLAGQTSRVLSNPSAVQRCVHRSRQRARRVRSVGRSRVRRPMYV